MASGEIFAELLRTIILVIYYILEALVLSLIPNSLRSRKSVAGETALITGAGHGIGRALAIRLSRLKCSVILLDINKTGLEEVYQVIKAEGGTVYQYVCDLSERQDIYDCAKKIHSDGLNVTILVNNAGVAYAKYLLELPDESVTQVFRVNTLAHFWTLKSFLPYMMEQNHGHIVTVASIAGKGAGSRASGYISSKFAAVGLHEAMEMELRALKRSGIHTTLVCPGLVETGLFSGAQYRFPRLIPTLQVDGLADDIVDTILRNGHVLIRPYIAQLAVRVKNLLPWKAFGVLTDFVGASTMLATFKGHQSAMVRNKVLY